MSQSSETEYDPEDSNAIAIDQDGYLSLFDEAPGHLDSDDDRQDAHSNVRSSITQRTLHSLKIFLEIMQEGAENAVDGKLEQLYACLGDIVRFILSVCGGSYISGEDRGYCSCMSSITDSTFWTFLLDLKRLVNTSVMIDDTRTVLGQSVVGLIDVLIAAAGEAIPVAASGQSCGCQFDTALPGSLRNQIQKEALRVANQLPNSWESLPDVLRSNFASPAAKRLALSIIFSSIIMRSDFENHDPWPESCFTARHVLECLQTFLDEMLPETHTLYNTHRSDAAGCIRRVSCAMLIGLYASADSHLGREEGASRLPFRPHTLASLLSLMDIILNVREPSETVLLKKLDPAQAILLRWGGTIPWAWSKWNDPRILNFNTVTKLTANWLSRVEYPPQVLHADGELVDKEDQRIQDWPEYTLTLKAAIHLDPGSSLVALFHQASLPLQETSSEMREGSLCIPCDRKRDLLRLSRTFWCFRELLMTCVALLDTSSLSLAASAIIELYGALDPSREGVELKAEVIRTLGAFDSNVLRPVFGDFQKDMKSKFVTSLAEATYHYSRALGGDDADRILGSEEDITRLIVIIDTICLLMSCGATSCCPLSSVSLISRLVLGLSSSSPLLGSVDLRISILNCLACARSPLRKSPFGVGPYWCFDKNFSDECVFDLALNVARVNLRLSTSFATYITVAARKSTDALLVAEAWDHLRDVLILLSTDRLNASNCDLQIGETAESICKGLEALISRADAEIAKFLLRSPLTLSLIHALRRPPALASLFRYSVESDPQHERHELVESQHSKICNAFDSLIHKMRKVEVALSKDD